MPSSPWEGTKPRMERNGLEPYPEVLLIQLCHCCVICLPVNNNAILQETRDTLFNAHRHIVIKSLHQGLIVIERHINSKFLK